MATNSSQLSAISRLFSAAVFRQMAKQGKSALFTRLLRETELAAGAGSSIYVRDAFQMAFDVLKAVGARDEYIYKAALTHRVLLGKHSLRTACMLTEFRAGQCKADVAILNGTTTVYEIKSERDSLTRLERQIDNYRQVFASVFVIAGEKHVDAVLRTMPSDVGVMQLSRRYQITTLREAENRPDRIVPLTVFEAIRIKEARDILANLGMFVPDFPNTVLHMELRKLFERLRPEDVHNAMLHTLKRTRNMMPLEDLVKRLPQSLQASALSVPLRRGDHERLLSAVNTPLGQAMSWA